MMIKEWAAEYDKQLTANDFNEVVLVAHLDGTTISCPNAKLIEKEDYYIVFTEHLGYFIVEKEDTAVMTKQID